MSEPEPTDPHESRAVRDSYNAIEHVFQYHRPQPEDLEKFIGLRAKAKELAHLIRYYCPESADRTIAIRKVREAVMYANASIANGGISPR